MSWSRKFDEPIVLPNGKKLVTLRDAIAWLASQFRSHSTICARFQAAAHCVTEATEKNGPMEFARIGMMQAIHRHTPPPPIDPSRKPQLGKAQAGERSVTIDTSNRPTTATHKVIFANVIASSIAATLSLRTIIQTASPS